MQISPHYARYILTTFARAQSRGKFHLLAWLRSSFKSESLILARNCGCDERKSVIFVTSFPQIHPSISMNITELCKVEWIILWRLQLTYISVSFSKCKVLIALFTSLLRNAYPSAKRGRGYVSFVSSSARDEKQFRWMKVVNGWSTRCTNWRASV